MRSKKVEILWHYTSIQNAINILTGREMWATNNHFLNDQYDIDKPLQHFLQYIEKKNYGPAFGKETIESLKITASGNYIGAFYVLSFSAQEDSLPLWRAYTPSGGCAIGFNKMALFDFFNAHPCAEEEKQHYYPLLNGLYKVNYRAMNGPSAFKKIEKEIDNYHKLCVASQTSKLLGRTYNVLQSCVATKDNAFSFEKEYRFVFLAKLSKISHSVFFNLGKPFIKIQLPPISQCVSKIILSPHGAGNLTIDSLNFVRQLICHQEEQDVFFPIESSACLQYRNPSV